MYEKTLGAKTSTNIQLFCSTVCVSILQHIIFFIFQATNTRHINWQNIKYNIFTNTNHSPIFCPCQHFTVFRSCLLLFSIILTSQLTVKLTSPWSQRDSEKIYILNSQKKRSWQIKWSIHMPHACSIYNYAK